jgi:adenylate kinase
MIILMGVAGAGKSMQGRLFADEHGFAWISTGELFRVLVTGERRQQMLEGKLLDDQEVIDMIDRTFNLIDLREEFLLDGFPRTIVQANWLKQQIDQQRIKLTAIFNLQASLDVVKKRLLKRARLDDTIESINLRFKEYQETTMPILDFFTQLKAPVYDIDANKDPLQVYNDISKKIFLN